MLLTLTDHLTCPRCGPDTGLILLMEVADDRRVRTGALGCPACRTQYPVTERVADLRLAADDQRADGGGGPARSAGHGAEGSGLSEASGAAESGAAAIRVAALLGLDEGRGFVLVDGPAGALRAGPLAGLAPDYEVVLALGDAPAGASGADMSSLRESGSLPIATRTMRAAAYLGGIPGEPRLLELLRVCRPTGRLLIDVTGAGHGAARGLDAAAELLEEQGAQIRARDELGLLAVAM